MDTKEDQKQYREKNKLKMKEYQRDYKLKNKDKLNEYRKEHFKSESGRKTQRIQTWKKRGIICDDWDETYEKFINCKNCELCNVEMVFGNSKYGRTLDHDHETGNIRNMGSYQFLHKNIKIFNTFKLKYKLNKEINDR